MALIAQATYDGVERLAERLSQGLRSARSLESAATWFARELRREYASVVLARVFATTAYSALPEAERRFAAAAAGDGVAVFPNTEVLTLFGSAGVRPEWDDRRLSQQHLAIPLLSRARVEEIPMVWRLLSDLRFQLEGDIEASPFVTRAFANANGLFYVADAATTVDNKGRHVVPGSAFVRDYGVGSVFGFGGSYVIQRMFVSTILFTQERIPKQCAMHFLQLSSTFKAATTRLVTRGILFDGERSVSSNG